MNVSRRRLLQLMASAGVATPLGTMFGRNAAASPSDVKALFVYVPDGVIPELWHPTGTSGNLTLPAMSEPLAPIVDDLVFVRGLDMYAGGATHEGGAAKVLTGVSDVSLDVFLGEQVGAGLPHRSVQLGVGTTFQGGGDKLISYVSGSPISPDDDPINAFDRLFSGLKTGPGGGGSDGPTLEQLRAGSVLDSAVDDIDRLQTVLGAAEREKLDVHLDALREVEQRVTGQITASCDEVVWNEEGYANSDADNYPTTYHREDNFGLVGKLQMDQLTLALACGVTRVGTLTWSHAVSPTRIMETGASRANHDASHYGSDINGEIAADFIAHRRWFMEQLVYLIERMKSIPDGSGTLLDNAVVFLCTEINDGNLHDHKDMPFLLAGGACGQLEPGRSLDFRGTNGGENEAHTKLLVSIAKMMGVDIETFGYDGHGAGGLDGL
ncbi:MAG: DUF1552 domain-containing protein [Myxococcota bacterium]